MNAAEEKDGNDASGAVVWRCVMTERGWRALKANRRKDRSIKILDLDYKMIATLNSMLMYDTVYTRYVTYQVNKLLYYIYYIYYIPY